MQIGKAFSDVRQNERRIKFIRVRNSVRTVGQYKGEPNPFKQLVANFYSIKTEKISTEMVALGDWLGCYGVCNMLGIFLSMGSEN